MLPPYRTLCPPGVAEMLLIMAGDVEQNPGPPKRNGQLYRSEVCNQLVYHKLGKISVKDCL